jgi:hypothetical protein
MESLDANITRENPSFNTAEISSYLMETAKWAKFLAIMGYIGIGLIVILGIVVVVMGSVASELFPGGIGGMSMAPFGLIYVALGAFYFFPVYYLHQFSMKIKQGLTSQDSHSMATGFQNLKSLFKFMGIFTIVILSIYAMVFLIAIVAGLASAM